MSRASADRPVGRRLRSASKAPNLPPLDLKPPDPDVFYNEQETASFIRLTSPKTLTIWRCRGQHPELKFSKPYGRVLYKGSSIISFLEGTAKEPETPKGRKRSAKQNGKLLDQK